MNQESGQRPSLSRFLLASIPGIFLLATLSIILILVIDRTQPSDHKKFWTINMIIMLLILSTFSLLFVVIFAAKSVQKRAEVDVETNQDNCQQKQDQSDEPQYQLAFVEIDLNQLADYYYQYLQSPQNSIVSDSPPPYETVVNYGDHPFASIPPPTYLESTHRQSLPEISGRPEVTDNSSEVESEHEFCEYCHQNCRFGPTNVFTVS